MMGTKLVDADGLRYLINSIENKIETEINNIITNVINEESTNTETPGALAVYEFVMSLFGSGNTGCIEQADELPDVGRDKTIYIIKQDGAATYEMYIYVDNEWHGLGTMEVNLSNYWSKDELTVLTNEEIQAIIDGTDE